VGHGGVSRIEHPGDKKIDMHYHTGQCPIYLYKDGKPAVFVFGVSVNRYRHGENHSDFCEQLQRDVRLIASMVALALEGSASFAEIADLIQQHNGEYARSLRDALGLQDTVSAAS
jgi:hypothetical protein